MGITCAARSLQPHVDTPASGRAERCQEEAERIRQSPRPRALVVAARMILDVLKVVPLLPTRSQKRAAKAPRVVHRAGPFVAAHVEMDPAGPQLAFIDHAD